MENGKKKKIWIVSIAVGVVLLLAAAVATWWFVLREREGIHDEVIEHPSISQLASFEGCLVHSIEEFNAGTTHLTGWYVVKKDDKYVRQWVATVEAWNRLFQNGRTRVIRLPEGWLKENLPVEGTVS